ncbi:unnamed protein product, partial [Staurois parvus]
MRWMDGSSGEVSASSRQAGSVSCGQRGTRGASREWSGSQARFSRGPSGQRGYRGSGRRMF